MTTRQAKLLNDSSQEKTVVIGAHTNFNGETFEKNSKPKKIKLASVALSAEDRKWAELEAGIVYYKGLIELKLRRGEEILEDDPLVSKLQSAINAYKSALYPHLTVEQIAELDD